MNWTFSNPAILIFIFLFCFSILSFYLYFLVLGRLWPLRKDSFRKRNADLFRTEEEISLFFSPLERSIQWLPTIASLSMLLGLLGTVLGISSSFAEMQAVGRVSLDVLAGGIKDALHTTIFGLLVAIPALFFHRSLENEIQNISELLLKDSLEKK